MRVRHGSHVPTGVATPCQAFLTIPAVVRAHRQSACNPPLAMPRAGKPRGGPRVRSPCHAWGVMAARRRPQAADPEQAGPTSPGTPWVRRGSVAASPSRGSSGRDAVWPSHRGCAASRGLFGRKATDLRGVAAPVDHDGAGKSDHHFSILVVPSGLHLHDPDVWA